LISLILDLDKLQRVQDNGPCRLQLQPLNISWTTVMEPALAASPAAGQLQTRQTLYNFIRLKGSVHNKQTLHK